MLVDQTHDQVTLTPPAEEPPPSDPTLAPEDPNCPSCADPILVSPQHDGLHLTSAEDGVLFDIDGDGVLDRVPWTEAGSDDAWLAMDRNGNGIIDDGSELFGNYTPAFAGQREPFARSGFDALNFLQGLANATARIARARPLAGFLIAAHTPARRRRCLSCRRDRRSDRCPSASRSIARRRTSPGTSRSASC